MAFADDLFILAGADCISVEIIKEALTEFYHSSGLKPNLQKSQFFFARVGIELKIAILDILPIPEGFFPVKYLGVPLISTRLRYEDYVLLKERTQQRIEISSNRTLSFGGRALLIQSILFNMQIYWCSLFILPQKILKEVEALLRAFLWSGLLLKKARAKVKWLEVCTPKSEGGLGFKSLKLWNKTSMLRHLWP